MIIEPSVSMDPTNLLKGRDHSIEIHSMSKLTGPLPPLNLCLNDSGNEYENDGTIDYFFEQEKKVFDTERKRKRSEDSLQPEEELVQSLKTPVKKFKKRVNKQLSKVNKK